MSDNFFSNEEIVFIFESNATSLFAAERMIEVEEKKNNDLKDITATNPIAKAIANIVKDLGVNTGDSLQAFKDGTSPAGRKFKLIKSIVSNLSLPYYAITGKTIEELRIEFKKDKGLNEQLDLLMKSIFK